MAKRRWQRRKLVAVQGPLGAPIRTNTIKAWSQLNTIRFTFSYDIVARLIFLRDGKAGKHNTYTWRRMHLEFLTLKDRSMPAVFVRLDQWRLDNDKSPHPKLSKREGFDHRFHTAIAAKRIGVKVPFKTTRLKLLWLKKPKGLLIIFPDEVHDFLVFSKWAMVFNRAAEFIGRFLKK